MAEIGYEVRSEFNDRYNLITRKMVRMLSENSRTSISDISKSVLLSRRTVVERMRKIEQELGIRYTVEFNESALGLVSPHIIAVKFDKKPDYDHVTRVLRQSYIPQFAATTRGRYDMIVYAIATSSRDYAHWDKSMQILLGEYGADWRPSEVVHRQLGFLPLRSEIIGRTQVPDKYKEMLKMLNENSRTSFQSISKKLGMHFNTVAYNFNKLLKTNYVKRFTITMDKPSQVTLMSFLSRYKPREDYENASAKARKAFMSDDDYPLISRYIMTAPLIGSYDFFTIGVFDSLDAAYRYDIRYHKQVQRRQGVRLLYGEIDRILFGRLPIRSVDTKKEYSTIVWTPELPE